MCKKVLWPKKNGFWRVFALKSGFNVPALATPSQVDRVRKDWWRVTSLQKVRSVRVQPPSICFSTFWSVFYGRLRWEQWVFWKGWADRCVWLLRWKKILIRSPSIKMPIKAKTKKAVFLRAFSKWSMASRISKGETDYWSKLARVTKPDGQRRETRFNIGPHLLYPACRWPSIFLDSFFFFLNYLEMLKDIWSEGNLSWVCFMFAS